MKENKMKNWMNVLIKNVPVVPIKISVKNK